MYCCVRCGRTKKQHMEGEIGACSTYDEGGRAFPCRASKCIHPINCTRRQECLSIKTDPKVPLDTIIFQNKKGEEVGRIEGIKMERNGSPEFYKIIEQMADTHSRKSHDYAMASNPFSNFERAGEIASWFKHPVDIAFAALIGVKLARMAELTASGKVPNNESLDDTQLDLATYSGLWAAWRKTQQK